jgi:hypothetical protein
LGLGAVERRYQHFARRLFVGEHAAELRWVLGVLLGIQLIVEGLALAYLCFFASNLDAGLLIMTVLTRRGAAELISGAELGEAEPCRSLAARHRH